MQRAGVSNPVTDVQMGVGSAVLGFAGSLVHGVGSLVDYAGRCVRIPDDPAEARDTADCAGKYEYGPILRDVLNQIEKDG